MSFLLQNDKRNILFWDMTIKGISRKRKVSSAAPLKLKTLITQLQKLRVKNFRNPEYLTYQVDTKRLSIILQGISFDNDNISMLFNVMDDKAAKQTFVNTETSRRRISEKTENEKAEYAVHMVISLNSNQEMKNTYSCVIEECPAISVTVLMRAFNAFLKKAAIDYPKKFSQPHPDGVIKKGKPEMMGTYCRVSIEGHPAEDFLDSVTNGKINGLVAISSYDVDRSIDSSGTVTPIARELKFSVSRSIIGTNNIGYYHKVRHYAYAHECPIVRVKFTDNNNQSYSVDINSETGNMVNERKFIKKLTLVDFKEELTTSSGILNLELRDKMNVALNSLIQKEPSFTLPNETIIGQEVRV